MPTNILEASVRLFADSDSLRASFQGLAPQAHLAGITVGDRFAAGMRKAVAQAHENFAKDFVGPLQSETFGGPGRGMAVRPAEQYRASDLAAQKAGEVQARAHVDRLQKIRTEASKGGSFVKALFTEPEAGGGEGAGGSGGEGGHSTMAKFAHMARIIAHDVTPAMSQLNPAMSEFIQHGAAAARTAVFFGAAIGGVAIAGAIASTVIGKYIEKSKEATEVTFQISQALKTLDASRAEAQFVKAAEKIDRFKLAADQISGAEPSNWWDRLIARFALGEESITGAVTASFGKLQKATAANIQIFSEGTFPKAQADMRVFNAGLLEREAQLNIQTAHTLEQLNAGYDKSTQSIRDRTVASIEGIQAQYRVDLAMGKTGAFDLANLAIDKARAAQKADLDAKAYERQRAVIAFEERQLAHAVRMGKISMADQLQAERAAVIDPRRTLQEQQEAEAKVYQTRREMAEAFVTFQSQLTGKSLFKERIDIGLGFINELVVGSAAWYAQTAKVADLFVQMREQAKGIFTQQIAIAIGEKERLGTEQERLAARQKANLEDEKIATGAGGGQATAKEQQDARDRIAAREQDERDRLKREDMAKISLSDIPTFLDRARDRDREALSGARVAPGDLSAAVGRIDLFRTIDKEGLGPREAFSRLMADPSKQFAQALGETTPVLGELAEAASLAAQALRGVAGAQRGQGSQSGPGPVQRQPGGPALSEENRQAILDTVTNRITDENLAVYGRR